MAGEDAATLDSLAEQRLIARYGLARIGVIGFVIVCCIAVAWIPLQAVRPIAKILAGKSTSLSVTISLTIAFTVVFGGSALLLWVKNQSQRSELRRARRRIQTLEGRLRDLGEDTR